MTSKPKIAFITDALTAIGGAEKVLFAALECFPDAQVHTLIYDQAGFIDTPLATRKVITSALAKLPLAKRHYRFLLPLMPVVIQKFDLKAYNLVVSFNYAVAHGAKVHPQARHVSYTYTPMRYAWRNLNLNGTPRRPIPVFDSFMKSFRKWDRAVAKRVNEFAAISQATSKRIQQAYQRKAQVIYPPVEVKRFRPASQRGDYYVALSRLVAHKRVDLIVDAFSLLGFPLIVIGDGPELKRLKDRGAPNIQFAGYQTDKGIARLLNQARGLVCATEEDFGIAIVEAQAAGCPVLAYGLGGALETVQEEKTGLFFHEQNVDCLMEALIKFDIQYNSFNQKDLLDNSQRFSKERFQSEFIAFVKGL